MPRSKKNKKNLDNILNKREQENKHKDAVFNMWMREYNPSKEDLKVFTDFHYRNRDEGFTSTAEAYENFFKVVELSTKYALMRRGVIEEDNKVEELVLPGEREGKERKRDKRSLKMKLLIDKLVKQRGDFESNLSFAILNCRLVRDLQFETDLEKKEEIKKQILEVDFYGNVELIHAKSRGLI